MSPHIGGIVFMLGSCRSGPDRLRTGSRIWIYSPLMERFEQQADQRFAWIQSRAITFNGPIAMAARVAEGTLIGPR